MALRLLGEMRDLPPVDPRQIPDACVQVSLLIPARNAADTLTATAERAREFLTHAYPLSFEIILIPNPAPGDLADKTTDVALQLAQKYPEMIRVAVHENPSGKGAALRTGFLKSRGRWVFFTDADLPYELDFFKTAGHYLMQGYSLVTGNRRLPESHFKVPVHLLRLAHARHRLGLGFNRVVRLLLPITTTDTQAGIKAMTRELASATFQKMVCPGFFFDLEFFLTARRLGLNQKDLTVALHLKNEKSTVRVLRESLLAGFWLARLAYLTRFGTYHSPQGTRMNSASILTRYAKAPFATRAFLKARWHLTPYLAMAAQLPPEGPILDLGCGHGLLSLAIALNHPREILAFDHDEGRIRLAQEAGKGIQGLHFEKRGMEFPDRKFSGITLIDVLHYFPRETQQAFLARAFEHLTPSGRLIVREVEPENKGPLSAWNRLYEKIATHTGFTRANQQSNRSELFFRTTQEWEQAMRDAGFKVHSFRCSSILFSDVLFVCERPA